MASRLSFRRWLLRDFLRAHMLFFLAAFGIGILIYLFDWSRSQTAVTPQSRDAINEENDKRYTGSIIIPTTGNLCRELTLDNRTGYLSEKGYVSCGEAISKLERKQTQQGIETMRLRAVGKAFNKSE